MRTISFDAGKLNFAYAIVENGKVLECGFLNCLITELNDKFSEQARKLEVEVKALLARANLNPATDYIVAERFMRRMRASKGCVSEFINLQLGLIAAWAGPIDVRLISASLWKSYFLRKYGTNDTPKLFDKFDAKKLQVHELDAVCMSLYCFEKETKQSLLNDCLPAQYVHVPQVKIKKPKIVKKKRVKRQSTKTKVAKPKKVSNSKKKEI